MISKRRDDYPLQVISVLGPVGDPGLESIMRNACDNDPEICERFTRRAWVQMMHPFDPHPEIIAERIASELLSTAEYTRRTHRICEGSDEQSEIPGVPGKPDQHG